MTTPHHTRDRNTFLECRDNARDLLRVSIVEDATTQFLALIFHEIHETSIAPLKAENTRLRKALEAIYTSRVTYYTAESDLTRLREIARAALQEDER